MTISILFGAIGTIFAVVWMMIFLGNRNAYGQYIQAIDKNQYFFPELFIIGFGCIQKFHINTNSRYANKRMKLFAELKGAKYSRFYYLVNLAGQITYLFTMATIGFLVAAASDPQVGVIIVVIGVFLAVYLDYTVQKEIEERREKIMRSFPHALSKMSLLINAGMPLREVIEKLAYAKDETLYREIGVMRDEIRNGTSERVAMQNFADRCGVQEVRKFASIMIQNMEKGSREMAGSLLEMSDSVWRERKSNVRQMGEKASAKLMVPIMMILLGIMVMVLVPMFTSISI